MVFKTSALLFGSLKMKSRIDLMVFYIFTIFTCAVLTEAISLNAKYDERNSVKSFSRAKAVNYNELLPDKLDLNDITVCNCGKYSTSCYFNRSRKVCSCSPGYSQTNTSSTGICEKCFCGNSAKSCEFISGQKKCNCVGKDQDVNGYCRECDCGPDSLECKYNHDQEKKCVCKDGFLLILTGFHGGEACIKCDCGLHSTSCMIDANAEIKCTCEQGYIPRTNTSLAGQQCIKCPCGPHSTSCRLDVFGYLRCSCENGFSPKFANSYYSDEICEANVTRAGWALGTYVSVIVFPFFALGVLVGLFIWWRKTRE